MIKICPFRTLYEGSRQPETRILTTTIITEDKEGLKMATGELRDLFFH